MALTTTPIGGYYTNSFADLEEAEAFLDDCGIDQTLWNSLTDGAKEFRLRLAAQLMGSGMFPWAGEVIYDKQGLCFPRDMQPNTTEIPDAIKEIQSILAVLSVSQNLAEQTSASTSSTVTTVLDNALVKSVEVMGLLKVALQNTVDSTTSSTVRPTIATGGRLSVVTQTFGSYVWMLAKPYLVQMRGESFLEVYPVKPMAPDLVET